MAEGRATAKYPDLLRKMAEEHQAHLEVSHSPEAVLQSSLLKPVRRCIRRPSHVCTIVEGIRYTVCFQPLETVTPHSANVDHHADGDVDAADAAGFDVLVSAAKASVTFRRGAVSLRHGTTVPGCS